MIVNNKHFRSIWFDKKVNEVRIIDQRYLPYDFKVITVESLSDFETAIKDMAVRGAPLIGATAAYGLALQTQRDPSDKSILEACDVLNTTRPTAINLSWALNKCKTELLAMEPSKRPSIAMDLAHKISNDDVETNRKIGLHGLEKIKSIAKKKEHSSPLNILTHCNAGWLATVDWGTATSPMYHAHEANIPIHVWVDETRPRNQGALTSWELGSHGISHNYITDNAGGHLMQSGAVDLVIVGTDRTTANGDVCNKIGTYLKALAAKDNGIPFYVALPSSTIDWSISDGVGQIPIEERPEKEVSLIQGMSKLGEVSEVKVTPDGSIGSNPAFDVTPARLVSGLITERGICEASSEGLLHLFPEKRSH